MRKRTWTLLAAALAVAQLSCASANMTPLPVSMPAARAGLQPEYRFFYDALADYGDWVLIEPYGYVFRPTDNIIGWRPYRDGYWAASDIYGWVWISDEPFGWATYHYGQWFYDRYEGWVWQPGLDWAPAWVTWNQTPDYVGWAPLGPAGSAPPASSYLYVPVGQLATTDLSAHAMSAKDVGPGLGQPEPVKNIVERDGVRFNRGPSLEWVEKRAGPVPRVKIADVAASATPGAGAPGSGTGARAIVKPGARPAPAGSAAAIESVRRAAEESAREARALGESKAPPPAEVVLPRPVRRKAAGGAPGEGRGREPRGGASDATADTTRH